MKPSLLATLLLLVACQQTSERATVSRINQLIKSPQPEAALVVADHYLKDQPGNVAIERCRALALLRLGELDQAAAAIRRLPRADPVWKQALEHSVPEVRVSAAKLIASPTIATPPVEPGLLIHALDDSEGEVRRACALTLGRLPTPVALRPLFRLLHDDVPAVRAEATRALGRLGNPRAIGWLAQLAADPDATVRHSVTLALRDLASETTRPALQDGFRRAGPHQQLDFAIALARTGDPAAFNILTNAITLTNQEIRLLAVMALGDLPAALVTNVLAPLQKDPNSLLRAEVNAILQRKVIPPPGP
jgi:HEAT repeat protein